MGVKLLAVACATLFGAMPSDAETSLYVLNKSEASVSVIDPGTHAIRAEIGVGDGPHEAATSPDGSMVVVCNYGLRGAPGSTLTVIDTRTMRVTKTIDLGRYHRPHGIVFLPDGKRVVVTAEQERVLLIVDIEQGVVVSAIDTEQSISHMVAVTPHSGLAFVANIGSGSVSVIDLEKGELKKILMTGKGAEGVAAHPSRPEVWVTNRDANMVSIINTKSMRVVENIPCSTFPIRVAFTPDGEHALVSNAQTGDVAVFKVSSRREIERIDMDSAAVDQEEKDRRLFGDRFGESPVPVGILIEPGGRWAYVANTNADVVTVLDLESWEISGRLTAGKEPDGLAWVGPGAE